MIICSGQNISKSFGGHTLFENLSFEIHENDRIGLVGRNGTGKTTIFKLLKGIEDPDGGAISIRRGTKTGYLAQIPKSEQGETAEGMLRRAFTHLLAIKDRMTALEKEMASADSLNLDRKLTQYGSFQEEFERSGGYEADAKLNKVAAGLGIKDLLNQSFHSLSGGEKTKVGLGLILLEEPDLLLLDEPTNHLDIRAVEWLEQFLKEYKGTVILISHDRQFLDEASTKIMDLDEGEITVYHSNYSGFIEEKQKRLMNEFQAYQEQQKKIKKMKEAIKQLKEWANQANPPSESLHKRARNMERALERMEKLKRPILEHRRMGLQFEGSERSGKRAISIEGVSKAFGEKKLFSEVNLELFYRDRLAIVGENGSGKSTLIRMILGEEKPDSGTARLDSSVKTGYLAQQLISAAEGEMTVIQYFREGLSMTEENARHILAKFLFYGASVFKKMVNTSGGERMRIQLAKLMQKDINLLILDEPTNHLDIESREVLEDAIDEFEGTVLAVSHDRYFLEKLFTKTAWIHGGTVYPFEGSYLYTRGKMEPIFMAAAEQSKSSAPAKEHASKPAKEITAEEIEEELMAIEDSLRNLSTESKDFSKLKTRWRELYDQLDSII
ncbi:ABC-F type ribosomal protection protein [Metabacillus sp. KIGAM252]|uniref:ABC-F type ribosomal protection protein n=1 Tax=Metabacillus flavus TaxID=2823519 RepID=A0ABS5LBD6_9BACI|nr:ABC-F type ribosomal protection protein [Metabacillus flavus]MBS2968036.1 ABC-F type ribosomal protection protein [Metabacillus flavus]